MRVIKFITTLTNQKLVVTPQSAALAHSTLWTLPAGAAQGGGDNRGVQAAAMVTVTTATTHQQVADIPAV